MAKKSKYRRWRNANRKGEGKIEKVNLIKANESKPNYLVIGQFDEINS